MSENLLRDELSPYLRQHAHNPVEWMPWSDEAFDLARRRDVPVLVSIGYSACHWCHVMERESFADPATAVRMNRALVCVKVDREERPDVDALYMEYLQRQTGRGGWPLNVFVTPEGVPFFGGTYFPPEGRHGIPSWQEIVDAVAEAYRTHRERILSGADDLARMLSGTPGTTSGAPSPAQVRAGIARQIDALDPVWGGFPGAPKFPPHGFLALCLGLHDLSPREGALLRLTLDRMAQGGIHDHVEGGFARYSTDEAWIVPHFEKMLYDNAQLLGAYAQAAARWGDPVHARVARRIASWMRRELGDPAGGFRASVDADVAGREGAHCTWTWKELEMLLGSDVTDFARAWNATPGGNFDGRNVLWTDSSEALAPDERAERWRSVLAAARAERARPAVDGKILASWNGLAIAGLARAGARLGDVALVDEARTTARFCRDRLLHDGGLWSVWKDGASKNAGTLEDWAFLGEGFLELWQATGELEWLDAAAAIGDRVLERFPRDDSPILRFTDRAHDTLFAQVAALHDNATPSGNAAAARLLARLWHLAGRTRHRTAAIAIVEAAGEAVAAHPRAFAAMAEAQRILSPDVLLVHLAGVASDPDFDAMRAVLQRGPAAPDVLVLGARAPLAGILRDGFCGSHPSSPEPAAWICRGAECLPPARTAEELRRILDSIA